MKEYTTENGQHVAWNQLRSPRLPLEHYQVAHEGLIQVCHDVIIEYRGGALLVMRTNYPAKNALYPVGGRMERGLAAEESLRQRVKAECNLDLTDIQHLGVARTIFATEPFGHGKGTDTVNLLFFARGHGELQLDDLHETPTIVYPPTYTPEFRASLDEYVRDLLDKTMPLIGK